MNPPFNLGSGLLLERSATLLPWGSTVEALTKLGAPEIYRHPSTTNIAWINEMVFGGLPVRVDMQGAAGPNAFYCQRTEMAGSVQLEYLELLADLSRRLGPPHSTMYEWSRWFWGDVAVSLRIAERFGEYVVMMVSKGLLRV